MPPGNVPQVIEEKREWVGTGETIRIGSNVDRIPEFDPRSGAHLWSWALLYRASPEKQVETPMLDNENLLLITGPGCYYCELPYSPLLAKRRCRGMA